MRKFFILFAVVGLLSVSCNNNKGKDGPNTNNREKDDYRGNKDDNNSDNDKAWSSGDKKKFNRECMDAIMKEGVEEGIAEKVCSCSLEKIEKKFSSYDDADGTSSNAKVIEDLMKDCATEVAGSNSRPDNTTTTTGGSWSSNDVRTYVENCVPSAMQNGLDRSAATSYCSCMQKKFERKYPDPNNLVSLSDDEIMDLTTRFAKDCVGGND